MGGIRSTVGIFSGVNSAQLIEQLLAIEQRPKVQIQRQTASLQQQRAAYLDINTSLSALKTAAQRFRVGNAFDASRAESSDATQVGASAANNAAAGSYQFTVKRLVTTQQVLSRGYGTGAAVGATSFSFELGGGSLTSETLLSDLNGGNGVERGKIVVRDAAGNSATVDLSTAKTVGDVIDSINSAAGIRVQAKVDGDRLVVRDNNQGVQSGSLSITSATGYNTAASLGIAGTAATGAGNAVTGTRIRTISGATSLSTLNDGNGVNIRDGTPDLFVRARDGTEFNITLGPIAEVNNGADPPVVTTPARPGATTVQDVINYFNAATSNKVTLALNADGTGLVATDNTSADDNPSPVNLVIRSTANTSRTTAKDLGIETAEAGVAANSVAGKRLISSLNSSLVSNLRGGSGITESALTVTDRAGVAATINLSAGTRDGSVDDLLSSINSQLETAGSGARVALNRAGNGLAITDSSTGSGSLVVAGAAATQLGINTAGATSGAVNGSNLQTKWLSRSTLLSSLNGGRGIGTGTIRITDSAGGISTLNITENQKTIDDLARFIESAGARVTVDINANGDGLIIRDVSSGAGSLRIEDRTGTVAKSLNLVGTDDNDGGVTEINGSFEREVTFSATDTVQTIATKINAEAVGVAAAVIRDGSGASPFRLSLTSLRSGSAGRFVIDTKNTDMNFSSLAKGEDSLAFYGAADPARAVLLSSSSNTLDNVIQGVTIDLKQATDAPVTVTVSRDTAAVEKTFDDFIKAYNDAIVKLDKYDNFDSESNKSGLLFGDATVTNIRNALRTTVQGTAQGVSGSMTRLFQIGIRSAEGGKLTIDKNKLRSMLEQDPQAVENLVSARKVVPRNNQVELQNGITVTNTSTRDTFTELGVLERLGESVTSLTSSTDGTVTRRGRYLDEQIKANGTRVDQLDVRLESKRARLERQFADMERAIASLQGQSSALGSISAIR
jgi:flagellar hook-associated protein 2